MGQMVSIHLHLVLSFFDVIGHPICIPAHIYNEVSPNLLLFHLLLKFIIIRLITLRD